MSLKNNKSHIMIELIPYDMAFFEKTSRDLLSISTIGFK